MLGLALVGCNAPVGSATVGASSDAGAPSSSVALLPAKSELSEFQRIPVDAAVRAQVALRDVLAQPRVDSVSYLAFRRAVSAGEPFFRDRGFVAEALFGEGPADETGGPLGRLDGALLAGDAQAIEQNGGEVMRALRLMQDAFERTGVLRGRASVMVPRAAFALGAIVAESRPGVAATEAGVLADAQGQLDAIESMVRAYGAEVSPSRDYGGKVDRIEGRIRTLRAAFEAGREAGTLSDRAVLIVETGKLGADLRALFAGDAEAWIAYPPLVSSGSDGASEPVSVLTVPRLRRMSEPGGEVEERKLAELGERLFSDKALSKGHVRSCASCHVPDKAYTDGKARAESLDPAAPALRNVPSLLYSSLQAAQFWDGRELTLSLQALVVVHSKAEMGDAKEAFPLPSVATASDAAWALAAFETWRLTPADSPLDRFARGAKDALSLEEKRGFDVFAGKGRCSRCHVPPLFGGSYPNDFSTAVYAVLGVPVAPGSRKLDPDRGRGGVTKLEKDMFSFKTPTLRNTARTAPYFHNGAFPTLESVIDFYDKGGGRGAGLDVPNQDPEVRPLSLTAAEKSALLHFVRTALADAKRK